MYERFTDRSRKVMQLANQECQRFNHEFIGTEHILLGLTKDGSGVAAAVLKGLGVDLRKIRLEIEKVVDAGPDRITMGKIPMTPRARKSIDLAIEAAKRLGHNYIGTEHLLLGLIAEGEGIACQVLANLEVGTENVEKEILRVLGTSQEAYRAALHEPVLEQADQPAVVAKDGTVEEPTKERMAESLLEEIRKWQASGICIPSSDWKIEWAAPQQTVEAMAQAMENMASHLKGMADDLRKLKGQ